jgi:hypothetical protein
MLNLRLFAFDIAAIDRLLVQDELVPCFDTDFFAEKLQAYLSGDTTVIDRHRPYLVMMCDKSRFQQEVCTQFESDQN